MNPDQPIRAQALAWAMQSSDPDFADWDGLMAWLEADPAHSAAYDAVQMALDDAAAAMQDAPERQPELRPEPEPLAANDNPPAGWRTPHRAWLGGAAAVAAAAVLVLAVTLALRLGPAGETLYTTAPGETRMIALSDGSTVQLAGGSRIAVAGGRARQARLEAGEALFTIRHDAADPFVLMVGEDRLVDAGTVFDVRLAGDAIDLAVADGAVVVNPQALALRVDAGERAVRRGGRYRVAPVDPGAVGEWAQGRISFSDASLPEIAAELTRATGIAFAAAPGDTRLSGSIALAAVRADPRALEALLGVRVTRTGAGTGTGTGTGWVIAGV